MPDHPAHLSPSELGTKDYWESFYERTLAHLSSKSKPGAAPVPTATADSDTDAPNTSTTDQNNSSDSDGEEGVDDDDDPGTSWFTEHNAPDKILAFLTSAEFPLAPCNTLPDAGPDAAKSKSKSKTAAPSKQQPSILDLGTGNGSLLALLRTKGGFAGDMVGVDYSERSIVLARELQRLKIHSAYWADSSHPSSAGGSNPGDNPDDGEEDDVVVAGASSLEPPNTAEAMRVSGDEGIRFEVWDILASDGEFSARPRRGMREEEEKEKEEERDDAGAGQRVCERYPGIARELVRRGGFLVVTSCNWTEEELVRWFVANGDGDDGLGVWGRVEYPRFRFGGHEGQGVCTVCFQRK
ncbi:S-adenosylmethionine-dependent methyltransferase [Aspergillus sp. HF37]|nr:S-adenosylmethionine-dependent methyltransferase [Aspergillus sp. HF37]